VRSIGIIAAVAILWMGSGWLLGMALAALFGIQWIGECMWLSLGIGMLLLLLSTRTEQQQAVLYDNAEKENDDTLSLAALLVGLPVSMVFIAILWWLMAQFLT
jgi:type IV secretory pathway TrbL component